MRQHHSSKIVMAYVVRTLVCGLKMTWRNKIRHFSCGINKLDQCYVQTSQCSSTGVGGHCCVLLQYIITMAFSSIKKCLQL
jgi:hypothetical protein